MKRLILILLTLLPLWLTAQTVPDVVRTAPTPATGGNKNNRSQIDANLYVNYSFRIPRGTAFSLNGAKDSIGYIMFNTTSNRLGVYRGGGVWDTYFVTPGGLSSQYIRGDGSLATFPSLTGFVPYTGATTDLDMGLHRIDASNLGISGFGNLTVINGSNRGVLDRGGLSVYTPATGLSTYTRNSIIYSDGTFSKTININPLVSLTRTSNIVFPDNIDGTVALKEDTIGDHGYLTRYQFYNGDNIVNGIYTFNDSVTVKSIRISPSSFGGIIIKDDSIKTEPGTGLFITSGQYLRLSSAYGTVVNNNMFEKDNRWALNVGDAHFAVNPSGNLGGIYIANTGSNAQLGFGDDGVNGQVTITYGNVIPTPSDGYLWARGGGYGSGGQRLLGSRDINSLIQGSSTGSIPNTRKWMLNAWKYNFQTPYHASEGILERRGSSDTVIQVMHIDSSGNHVSDNGRLVVRRSLDKGETWGAISTIADSLNVDDRNAAGGNIGTNFVVFYRQYKKATSTQIGTGYRISSNGVAFGNYIQLATGAAAGIPFGRPVKLHDGSWIQTFYSVTGGTNTGFLRRTTDNGHTWGSPVTIFSTPTSTKNYSELCIARVNTSPTTADSLICIVRDDGPSNSRDSSYVQFVSIGDYTSWTFKGRTNLGNYSFDVTPSIGYDAQEKKVFVLAANRIKGNTLQYPAGYTNKILLYVNNVSDVINNPTAWAEQSSISRPWPSNITLYGHVLFTKVDTNRYLVLFTDRDNRSYPNPRGDDYEIANLFQSSVSIGNSRFTPDSLNRGALILNPITNRYETKATDTAFFRNKQTNTISNIGKNGLEIVAAGVDNTAFGLAILDSAYNANFVVRNDGSIYAKPISTTSTSGAYQLVTQNTSTGFIEKIAQPNFITTDNSNITNMTTVSSQDLNTVTGDRAFAAVSPTNGPSGAGNGALFQLSRSSSIQTQLYFPISLTAVTPYVRNTQTGSAGWGSWIKLLAGTGTTSQIFDGTGALITALPSGITATTPTASGQVANKGYIDGGFLPINNPSATGLLKVTNTSEAFRVAYNGSNYLSFTPNSTGGATVTQTGSGAFTTFSGGAYHFPVTSFDITMPNAGTIGPVINAGDATRATLTLQNSSSITEMQFYGDGHGIVNSYWQAKSFNVEGSSSGIVSILPQPTAGTYNFNLPITAGSAGQVLTSQGGGGNAMTWSDVQPVRVVNTITSNSTVPTLIATSDYTYIANSASLLSVAIPANSMAGARITLDGLGTGGAKFTLNTGDTIVSVGGSTTISTGSVSIIQKSSITIECETTGSSGNTWIVRAVQGTPTYL